MTYLAQRQTPDGWQTTYAGNAKEAQRWVKTLRAQGHTARLTWDNSPTDDDAWAVQLAGDDMRWHTEHTGSLADANRYADEYRALGWTVRVIYQHQHQPPRKPRRYDQQRDQP